MPSIPEVRIPVWKKAGFKSEKQMHEELKKDFKPRPNELARILIAPKEKKS